MEDFIDFIGGGAGDAIELLFDLGTAAAESLAGDKDETEGGD